MLAVRLLYARRTLGRARARAYHARAIAAAGTATRPRADADPKSTSNVIAEPAATRARRTGARRARRGRASAGDAWIVAMSPGDHPKRWAKAKSLATTTEERLGLPAGWIFDGVSAARAFAPSSEIASRARKFDGTHQTRTEPSRTTELTTPTMELTTLTLELTPGLLTLGLLTLGLSGGTPSPGCFVAGGGGPRGGWDSARCGCAPSTIRGGRRHGAARRREAGRRGGVRRWGERVRSRNPPRLDGRSRCELRRRARRSWCTSASGREYYRCCPRRTKDPPPSVVDATTNEIHVTVHRPASKVIKHTRTVVVRARARGAVRDARVGTRARGQALRRARTRSRRYRSCVRRPTTRAPDAAPSCRRFAAGCVPAKRDDATRADETRVGSKRAPSLLPHPLSRTARGAVRATRSLPSSPSTARRARARCVCGPRSSRDGVGAPRRSLFFSRPRGPPPRFRRASPTPPEPGRECASPVPVARTLRRRRASFSASRPTPPKSPSAPPSPPSATSRRARGRRHRRRARLPHPRGVPTRPPSIASIDAPNAATRSIGTERTETAGTERIGIETVRRDRDRVRVESLPEPAVGVDSPIGRVRDESSPVFEPPASRGARAPVYDRAAGAWRARCSPPRAMPSRRARTCVSWRGGWNRPWRVSTRPTTEWSTTTRKTQSATTRARAERIGTHPWTHLWTPISPRKERVSSSNPLSFAAVATLCDGALWARFRAAFDALLRRVSSECRDRGRLLSRVWTRTVALVDARARADAESRWVAERARRRARRRRTRRSRARSSRRPATNFERR